MSNSGMNLTRVEVMVPISGTGLLAVEDIEDIRLRAYAIMRDLERYPAYMPSVNSIDILERKDNEMTTRWDAEIDGAPICWVQTVLTLDESQEMFFEAIEGDFEVFKGKWSVIESGGQVCLELLVEYRLGIPVIEDVLGPILKEKVKANSEAMLDAIVLQL